MSRYWFSSDSFVLDRLRLASTSGVLWLILTASALAQSSPCNPGLRSVEDSPFGYRQRGDRCEGIYWQPHAGPAATIAILAVLPTPVPSGDVPDGVWRLSWPPRIPFAVDDSVRLQATSLRRGLFYRMDGVGRLQTGRYDWATDVLRGLALQRAQVSLRVEIKVRMGGILWPVVLPVWIGSPVRPTAELRAMLTSTTALYGLTWQCLRMNPNGMPGTTIAKGRLEGPFKADEPFALPLALPGFSGLCYLEINGEAVAKPVSGDPAISAVIFAPGDGP